MRQGAMQRMFMRFLALACCCWVLGAARSSLPVAPAFAPSDVDGRLIILPGIHNTLFHLDGFVAAARESLPNFVIDQRIWGIPFMGIRNLRAHEDNVEFARTVAADIVQLRSADPQRKIYLMGYSGGGGVASLVLAQLPAGVMIDRLLLIAPAISSDYAIESLAAEHVSEIVVNFASEKDLQVGLGTRIFGTIDREYVYAAGYDGFATQFPALAQWHWRPEDRRFGHLGNHISYLGRRWQRLFLLPAVDPALDSAALQQLWAQHRAR